MGMVTKMRTWAVHRTIFDKIPVRGLFSFQNGNPSGVFVKVSPGLCARPAQEHLNNPHFAFRTVLPRGTGSFFFAGSGASDFAFWQGNTVRASRATRVFEVNPSYVVTEADARDW